MPLGREPRVPGRERRAGRDLLPGAVRAPASGDPRADLYPPAMRGVAGTPPPDTLVRAGPHRVRFSRAISLVVPLRGELGMQRRQRRRRSGHPARAHRTAGAVLHAVRDARPPGVRRITRALPPGDATRTASHVPRSHGTVQTRMPLPGDPLEERKRWGVPASHGEHIMPAVGEAAQPGAPTPVFPGGRDRDRAIIATTRRLNGCRASAAPRRWLRVRQRVRGPSVAPRRA